MNKVKKQDVGTESNSERGDGRWFAGKIKYENFFLKISLFTDLLNL